MLMENKIRFFLVSICFFSFLPFFQSCDSTNNSGPGQKRYNHLVDKADRFLKSNPDSAIIYADSALKIVRKRELKGVSFSRVIKLKAGALEKKGLHDSAYGLLESAWLESEIYSDTLSKADLARELASLNQNRGQLSLAERFLSEASVLYNKIGLPYEKNKCDVAHAVTLALMGELSKSQQCLIKAYTFFEKSDSINALNELCLHIGNNYADMGNIRMARHYYAKILDDPSAKNKYRLSALLNMGTLFRSAFPDSALYYYNKADYQIKISGDESELVKLKYNQANIYLSQKDYAKAKTIFKEVLDYSLRHRIFPGISRAQQGISIVYELNNRYDSAIYYRTLALNSANELGEMTVVVSLLDDMATLYKKQGNLPKVIELQQRAKHIADSLQTINNQVASVDLLMLNELYKKEMESRQLKNDLVNKQTRLRFNFILVMVLSAASILLVVLLRKSILLYRERAHAHSALMDKYLAEMAAKAAFPGDNQLLNPDSSGTLENNDPLLLALIQFYQTDKPYLDPKLKVEDILEKLNTTHRILNQVLKKFKNSNFTNFTNYFRVEEARRMMENPKFANHKIEAIAKESGFGTRMSFYNAFEKQTGIKPSYYRNTILQKMENQPS